MTRRLLFSADRLSSLWLDLKKKTRAEMYMYTLITAIFELKLIEVGRLLMKILQIERRGGESLDV